MAEQDFLPFAGGGGANVVSQASYATLPAVASGFSSGIAPSNVCNKAWRQSSIIAAVVAQLIADVTGQDVIDDGTTETILSNLLQALTVAAYQTDTGVANAYALTYSPSLGLQAGMSVRFKAAHTNTGASTLAINGSSPKTILGQDGSALTGGEIVANGIVSVAYNGTNFVISANSSGYAKSATPPVGDNSTKVATTAFVQANGLGSSQTWHNVTGSRALSTNYTNSHGNPIMVSVFLDAGTSWGVSFIVGGVTIGGTGGNGTPGGGSFIVPAGETYQVSGSGETINQWAELY